MTPEAKDQLIADLSQALRDIESHHARLNDSRGRPQESSRTLRIAREALAKLPRPLHPGQLLLEFMND